MEVRMEVSGREIRLTQGQRDGLLAAGIIRPWGAQWGTPGYVLAPGMTWDDVLATGAVVLEPARVHGTAYRYAPRVQS